MRFLLLNPLTLADFEGGITTFDELTEALQEFGCSYVSSMALDGFSRIYITAPTKEALGNLCTSLDLAGDAVEYQHIYNQVIY